MPEAASTISNLVLIIQISAQLKQALESYLADVVHNIKAWGGAFNMPDTGKQEIVTVAAFNLPDDWLLVRNPLQGSNFNAQAANSGQTVRLNNMFLDTITGTVTKHPVTAVMVMPVFTSGVFTGNLEFMHDQRYMQFSDRDEAYTASRIKELLSLLA